jgi:hypothetical protein
MSDRAFCCHVMRALLIERTEQNGMPNLSNATILGQFTAPRKHSKVAVQCNSIQLQKRIHELVTVTLQ